MSIYSQSQPSLNARMIKILWRQQQELLKKSPDHVTPIINSEDPIDIQADIEGPEGTPYECGIFRVKLFIPSEFPQVAPKGFFVTKIFHPNVSEKGEICVNTLKRDWNPKQWSLYNLFEVIKCLLIVPFPQSSLNEEAGKMFMDNYEEYFKVPKSLNDAFYDINVNDAVGILEIEIDHTMKRYVAFSNFLKYYDVSTPEAMAENGIELVKSIT